MKKIAFLLFFGLFLSNSCTVVDPELIALIQDIEKQNVALTSLINSLQTKSDSLINELKKSDTKQTELIQRITNLQSELAKVLTQMNAINQQLEKQGADLTAINALLADLQKKYEGILGQLTQLQRLSQILLELEALKKQLADLDSKYQVITTTLGQNQQALDALKAQITALQSQMTQNLTKIDQLTTQLGEQGVDIDKLLAEIDALKKSTEELKAKIDEILRGKSPVPTAGLVAWYPFNGNANDESGKENNGTVFGSSLVTDRFNQPNKAMGFDGVNDYVALGTYFNFTNFSISMWIKPGTQNGHAVIIDNNHSSNNNWVCQTIENWQTNGYYFPNSANSFTLTAENWTHIVLSIVGGSTSVYRNGVLVSQSTWNLNYNNSVSLNLGVWKIANARFWKGVQDDIGIWNRALTTQEITKIYNGEKF